MSAVATIVERSSRFVLLVGLPNGHTSDVAAALAEKIDRAAGRPSPIAHLGPRLGDGQHAASRVASGMPVYFCDPRNPWQRGTNENTNGLLRRYFPKRGFDLRTLTQTQLDDVADELNGRPRQPSAGDHHHKYSITRFDDPLRPQAEWGIHRCLWPRSR